MNPQKVRELVLGGDDDNRNTPDFYRIVSWLLILIVGFFVRHELQQIEDSIIKLQETAVSQGQSIARLQVLMERK